MSQETVDVREVETDSLNAEADYRIKPNDHGEVPLVNGDDVVTQAEIVHARQERLEHLREKMSGGTMAGTDTRQRRREKKRELSRSMVVHGPFEPGDEKREAIQRLVDVDLSNVDKRFLTSILYASRHWDVAAIITGHRSVRFDMTDDAFTARGTQTVELSAVGDEVIVQARQNGDGKSRCVSFAEGYLQEDDILYEVKCLVGRKSGWSGL